MLDGVWAFLGRNDLRTGGRNIMLYRNDVPYLEFEVGVEVSRTFESAGVVVASSLREGRAVHTIHTGDNAGLGEAHDAIARWSRTNGYTPSGTCWEGLRRLEPGPRQGANGPLLAPGELTGFRYVSAAHSAVGWPPRRATIAGGPFRPLRSPGRDTRRRPTLPLPQLGAAAAC
jgi:hypothetical protein